MSIVYGTMLSIEWLQNIALRNSIQILSMFDKPERR